MALRHARAHLLAGAEGGNWGSVQYGVEVGNDSDHALLLLELELFFCRLVVGFLLFLLVFGRGGGLGGGGAGGLRGGLGQRFVGEIIGGQIYGEGLEGGYEIF